MEKLDNLTKQEKKVYHLIKGNFPPDDALEILNSLISSKLNFHTLRNFSFKERTGKSDEYSLGRIIELSHTAASIAELVQEARRDGKQLIINSEISIALIENNTISNQ